MRVTRLAVHKHFTCMTDDTQDIVVGDSLTINRLCVFIVASEAMGD